MIRITWLGINGGRQEISQWQKSKVRLEYSMKDGDFEPVCIVHVKPDKGSHELE